MKVDAVTLFQLLGICCVGFLFSVFGGLPLTTAIACGIALGVFCFCNYIVSHLQIMGVLGALANEYARQLNEIQNQSSPKPAELPEERLIKFPDYIASWEDPRHPYRHEIEKDNELFTAGFKRYPILGQLLYTTPEEVMKEGMLLGLVTKERDGLDYPLFARKEPESSLLASALPKDISGTIEGYFYDLNTQEEFVIISTTSQEKYLLMLPKNRNIKPFQVEPVN